MTNSREIGETVRKLRKEQKLTQAQLAGFANTGVRFISDLERGKESCELAPMLRVISALGLVFELRNPYDKGKF